MAQALERRSIQRKARDVEQLVGLIDAYNVIAFASLYKVRAIQLQELAKRFRSNLLMKVAKNILVKRALEKSAKTNVGDLAKHLTGSNILLFTDMNPFHLSLLFDRNKIRTTAKAGDIAPDDIVISAGNTGLPPGPAISELHDAGVRTRIEAGSVWVSRDTVVTQAGEAIPLKVASVLSKMGIKPLEVGLKVVAAYDDGEIFTTDQLTLDLNDVKQRFEAAHIQAINLSINVPYPTTATIEAILQRGHSEAKCLAINAAYVTPEVAADVLARAYGHMASVASHLAKVNKDAAPKEFHG